MARGGMPRGGGNMQAMMRQAQQAQMKIQQIQKEIEEMTYESAAGGGMVKATVKGNGRVLGVKIDPIAIDPSDPEMLEDMIVAAVNGGFDAISAIGNAKMAEVTGGLNIPGLGL